MASITAWVRRAVVTVPSSRTVSRSVLSEIAGQKGALVMSPSSVAVVGPSGMPLAFVRPEPPRVRGSLG